jgi:hypothetical protein
MRTTPRTLTTLFALATVGVLQAGCGDSRYSDFVDAAPPPPAATENDVPAHALASSAGLVQWAQGLSTNENGEPLRVQGANLPFTDTTEPQSL